MDVLKIREDFPIFKVHKDLVYFDNASTTFKPKEVLDAIIHYYHNSTNIGRGEYKLAINNEKQFEATRKNIASFINASENEIVLLKNASEALNFIAISFGKNIIQKDDVVLTTTFEHASSILPWMNLCEEKQAKLEYIALNEKLKINFTAFKNQLNEKVKVIVIAHISNVLGYENDIQKICDIANKLKIPVIIDASQSVAHTAIDVKKLNCAFLIFSSHKIYGPNGVGVLYGKHSLLQRCTPFVFGGGANARYTKEGDIILKEIPYRFEVGTPAIENVLGFDAALNYIKKIGINNIQRYEMNLRKYCIEKLKKLKNIILYNEDAQTTILFNVKGIFAQDVASYLNSKNIAVRSGQHCSKILPLENTLRISLAFYNTKEEIDYFIEAISAITLEKTLDIFF